MVLHLNKSVPLIIIPTDADILASVKLIDSPANRLLWNIYNGQIIFAENGARLNEPFGIDLTPEYKTHADLAVSVKYINSKIEKVNAYLTARLIHDQYVELNDFDNLLAGKIPVGLISPKGLKIGDDVLQNIAKRAQKYGGLDPQYKDVFKFDA